MQAKRILWLYNHSTLIKSEVRILRELGYEVYVPKVIPFDVSVAVDWESDKLLSVPQEALDILNQVDFYGQQIPMEAMDVMNRYFDMAVFGIFIEPLKSLAMYYKGTMIFHPFGLEDGTSYTQIIELSAGIWLLKRLEEIGNRFWFGQSYENLMEIECDFFKKRTINLPIGMLDTEIVDKWHGSAHKLLFICPRIKISPYYENIYKEFKREFKDIPHSIGGAQPIPVEGDKAILGYLPQKEYEDLYPSHSVMFYHSVNKRHIHYHPFEAVKCGLPLIFMGGGLIDDLGGRSLPGRCETIAEAKKKCRRIIRGDKRYAEKIRASQKVLLEKMSYQYCLDEWKKAMKKIDTEENEVETERFGRKRKKIAFVLPQMYLGGVLDYSLRLIKAFATGQKAANEDTELIFAVPNEMCKKHYAEIRKVEEYGVKIRGFFWESADRKRIERLTQLIGYPLSAYREQYYLLNDGISYFEDCDFLLFLADRVSASVFLMKPYGVILHDYMRRYVPEQLEEKYEAAIAELVRQSQHNFTTTAVAARDCIQYIGVPKERITLLPLFFEDISGKGRQKEKQEKYFIWSTNISPHKNHTVALEALARYYRQGGRLQCYVTGVNTNLFSMGKKSGLAGLADSQKEYVGKIRRLITNNEELVENVHFLGQLDKEKYYDYVKNAEFMIHPGMADNGNGAVVDAAFLGVPAISSDYPAMRNLDEKLQLKLLFFDKTDAEQLKEKLFWAQEHSGEMRKKLPENLKKHTVEDEELCREIYRIIRENIFISFV